MIAVSQVMTGNPVTVHRDDPIRKAFDLMMKGQFRRLPIANDGKNEVKLLKEKNRGDLK
jgi:CBS domain-containing protein